MHNIWFAANIQINLILQTQKMEKSTVPQTDYDSAEYPVALRYAVLNLNMIKILLYYYYMKYYMPLALGLVGK